MVNCDLVDRTELQNNLANRIQEAELFSRKFGSFTKSDYEVLMFTAYLDSLMKPARDQDISISLGITESKVRNLRVKSQLLYPRELNWVEELTKSVSHGYYDRMTGQITVTFEDPSVRSLLKNRIEEDFGMVGQSLNAKQLILPIESFLLLAANAETDEKKIIEELNKALKSETKKQSEIEKKNLKARFLEGVPDTVSFISSVISTYQRGRPVVDALLRIIL